MEHVYVDVLEDLSPIHVIIAVAVFIIYYYATEPGLIRGEN